jgi:peptidoglycan hydrolase CwlO-like protein
MDERTRERYLLVCIIIGVFSLILAISSGISAQKNKVAFQKEMATRLDIEEQLENSKFVISALEEEIEKLQSQVNVEREARQKLKTELEEEKLVTKALKEEIIKTNRLKETLERNLKEALATQAPMGAQ